MMNYYAGLPLFPLNMVLFPGQILRLHIFEPRYLQMVKDCMAGEGIFGVALIKRGSEVGVPAEPHPTGVTSRILEVNQLEDGTIDLVSAGKKRFIIHSVAQNQPYLTCEAELWPWSYNPEKDDAFAVSLKNELRQYFSAISHQVGGAFPIPGSLPDDTFNLACLAAISLKIIDREKQGLLDTITLQELATNCRRLLRREILILNRLNAFPDGLVEKTQFYSNN